jgi:hypothetical protein
MASQKNGCLGTTRRSPHRQLTHPHRRIAPSVAGCPLPSHSPKFTHDHQSKPLLLSSVASENSVVPCFQPPQSPIAQAMRGARRQRSINPAPHLPPPTSTNQRVSVRLQPPPNTPPTVRRSVEFIPRESHGAPILHSRRMNSTLRFRFRPAFAPLRATSSNQISPVQFATSVDPLPMLRN